MSTLSDFEDHQTVSWDEMQDEDADLARQMIDRIEAVPQVGEARGRYEDVDGLEVDDVTHAGGGRLPAWELPGFNDDTMQDDCGHSQPHFCDECGAVHDRSRRCRQSRCPECWQSWAMDKAETHGARADAVARTLGSSGEAHHKHHVEFMAPNDWRPTGPPEERYRKTWNLIRDIISEVWGDNAVVAYHGWSGSGYGDDEGDGDDLGEWKGRMPDGVDDDREWEGDVRDELFRRPHFHAVIVSEHIPGGDIITKVNDATGWVIKRNHGDDNRSIDGDAALARVLTYTLSHASIDTSGERNDAKVHTCGSEWHNYRGIKTLRDSELRIKRAVRAVAPKTLGVAEDRISCAEEIVPERVAGADEFHSEDHGDDAGTVDVDRAGSGDAVSFTGRVTGVDEAAGVVTIQSGTTRQTVAVDELGGLRVGDKVAASGTVDDDGVVDGELSDPRVGCQGTMRHIKDAPELLEDDRWSARAQHADQAEAWYAWWTGADGAPPEPPSR